MEKNADTIVQEMMDKDLFSQWLGIKVVEVKEGYCRLSMQVRKEMCNGFDIAHGGICYSFADTALAFASNSRGKHALSTDTHISHVKSIAPGITIFATATEIKYGQHIAHYLVKIENETSDTLAIFKGTVFITTTAW